MPKKKKTMTTKEAIALMTGTRGISDPSIGCLGEGDLLALQTLLKAYEEQHRALAVLIGSASALLDDYSSLLEAGILENEDGDRESLANALCDDLAMSIGKADIALDDNE